MKPNKKKLANAKCVKEFLRRFSQNIFRNRQYIASKCIYDRELLDIKVNQREVN